MSSLQLTEVARKKEIDYHCSVPVELQCYQKGQTVCCKPVRTGSGCSGIGGVTIEDNLRSFLRRNLRLGQVEIVFAVIQQYRIELRGSPLFR